MPAKLSPRLTALFCIGAFFVPFSLQSLTAQATPAQPEIQLAQRSTNSRRSATQPDVYQQAKKELPAELYVAYRVTDRLARANQLDSKPWRVLLVPTYEINAFADEVNLIALHHGMVDQLAGDASALACVIGHEMGHHVKRHQALGPKERLAMIEQFQKEAEAEINATVNDARTTSTVTGLLGGALGSFGGWFGVGGGLLRGYSNQSQLDGQRRVQELVKQKLQDLEQRLTAMEQRQEFEADEAGYLYSATAGFEPEGCLRLMAVFGQMPGTETDSHSTHPAVPRRIAAIKDLMSKYPAASLKATGNARIAATKPLTYDRSLDKVSLRINSTRGGQSSDDLQRLFGR